MARFDLYRWESRLVVDVQTDLLDGLNTRIVIPLVPLRGAPVPAGRLNPLLDIDGELFALQPQLRGAVPTVALGRPIDNLMRHYDRIRCGGRYDLPRLLGLEPSIRLAQVPDS